MSILAESLKTAFMKKFPMIILYVADKQRSTLFYTKILNQKPVLNVPGMTEFMLNDHFKLGLMPENGIAKIICPACKHPKLGNGIPRCELYLIVEDPALSLSDALNAGAVIISGSAPRDWGDTVSYCQDPDGHVIAFAV
jgi:catechol 2,3-dioxygenase-like lactoylglutathione lyase family enzyme